MRAEKWRCRCLVANRATLPQKRPPLSRNLADSCELTATTKQTEPSFSCGIVVNAEGCDARDAGRSGVQTPGGGASFDLANKGGRRHLVDGDARAFLLDLEDVLPPLDVAHPQRTVYEASGLTILLISLFCIAILTRKSLK